jgi:tRNA A-37 threonylcarbamoyl transferase component Bud32
MELRRLVRGRLPWSRLEAVVAHLAERYDCERVHVRFLDADNWLSTPMVLDDELFVKVISRQNSLVHAVLTTGRNLGAFSSGTEGFFEHFGTPYQMAQHELEATKKMRELGINAPEPIEALEFDDLGIVVMEYLPEFESLEALDRSREKELAPQLFESLRTLHDNGLAHGDLRAENVLILDDELYFIDATGVNPDATEDARAYDLACALGALEPLIGVRAAVESALSAYSIEELLAATEFLDFVNIRPDHDFSAASVKGEIEKRAS